jgi:hypothetical protein
MTQLNPTSWNVSRESLQLPDIAVSFPTSLWVYVSYTDAFGYLKLCTLSLRKRYLKALLLLIFTFVPNCVLHLWILLFFSFVLGIWKWVMCFISTQKFSFCWKRICYWCCLWRRSYIYNNVCRIFIVMYTLYCLKYELLVTWIVMHWVLFCVFIMLLIIIYLHIFSCCCYFCVIFCVLVVILWFATRILCYHGNEQSISCFNLVIIVVGSVGLIHWLKITIVWVVYLHLLGIFCFEISEQKQAVVTDGFIVFLVLPW